MNLSRIEISNKISDTLDTLDVNIKNKGGLKNLIDVEPTFNYEDRNKKIKITDKSRQFELVIAFALSDTLGIPFIGKKPKNYEQLTENKRYIEEQPYGSQNPIDLIIHYDDYIQKIEIKTNSSGGKPVLNGSYPKNDVLYIHYDEKKNHVNYKFADVKEFINKPINLEKSIEVISELINEYNKNCKMKTENEYMKERILLIKNLSDYLAYDEDFIEMNPLAEFYFRSTVQNKNFTFSKMDTLNERDNTLEKLTKGSKND